MMKFIGPKSAKSDFAAGRAKKARAPAMALPSNIRNNPGKYKLQFWKVGGGSQYGNSSYFFATYEAPKPKPKPTPRAPAPKPAVHQGPVYRPPPPPPPVNAPITQAEINAISKPGQGLESTTKAPASVTPPSYIPGAIGYTSYTDVSPSATFTASKKKRRQGALVTL